MENNISKKIYKILEESKKISMINTEKSLKLSENAYNLAIANNMKVEEGHALVGMAHVYRVKSDNCKVLDYSYRALEIFEEKKDKIGKMRALNLIGITYFYSSMYEDALKNFLKIIDLLEDCYDQFLFICANTNIGEVYKESDKYEMAIEYYNKVLKVSLSNDLNLTTANTFNNIGEIHFKQNNFNDALRYYNESYEMLKKEKDMILLGSVENNLGKLYLNIKKYNKAEELLFSALKRLENLNDKFYYIDVLKNIGILKLENSSNEAYDYFEKAIQISEEINAKKQLSEICKILSEHYENRDDYKTSLKYFKKYSLVNEEVMTANVGNKLEILKIELGYLKEKDKHVKIKTINQRLEMEILNKRNEVENIKLSNFDLEKKTVEDELTKIPNRRFINQYLHNSWKDFLLKDDILILYMIDIDNFKKYNDSWGHLKGDKCLKEVARVMKKIQVKRKDIVARYGGEEFIYFAKNINYDQALELGNLIRTEVENLGIKHGNENNGKTLTISVGGSIGKASSFDNIINMIQEADKQLYKSKNMGRNITLLKEFT